MFTTVITYAIGGVAVAAVVALAAQAAAKRRQPVPARKSNRRAHAREVLGIAAGLALTLSLSACGESATGEAEDKQDKPAKEAENADDGETVPVQVTDKEHFQKVTADGRVLVDFYADWCGPCKAMEPILKDMANEHSDTLTIAKVNVDKHGDLAREHGVRGIPHLVLYEDGEAVDSSTGYRDKKALTNWLAESEEE